jgi:hypothetical protein
MATIRYSYIIGQQIGLCTYLGNDLVKVDGRHATFKCSCGAEFVGHISRIKSGHTKSCGCLQKKVVSKTMKKHGLSGSPEYYVWEQMKQRCYNPKHKHFDLWGGRGIRMCAEWFNSFEAFFQDMGSRPTSKHQLDRIDNNGNYEKGNCKWATKREQTNNMRSNVFIEYRGMEKTLTQWCEELGLNYQTMWNRIRERNMDSVTAFETPINTKYGRAN